MCDMEGLVPALREFLCTTLSAERLSNQAETKRQVLINQLDVVTQPPTLPPRPGDLPPLAPLASGLPSNGDDDFLAQQRALSRQTAPSNGHHDDDPGEMYEDFPGDGDLYEEPCMMEDAEQPRRLSDSGSATSYESYSDFTEDDMDPAYENEQFTPVEDIPLPRIPEEHSITYQTGRKTKKKKKKPSSGDSGVPACRLSGATHRGELSQKGVFSLTKYYCLIHNNMLLCYKSEKDVRPHFKFLLLGYEVLYMEKDGKYSHAIRISHPGCETIMFYADSKEAAQVWCQYMTSASRGLEVAASVDAVEQGHSGDGSVGGGSTSERSGTTLSRTNSGASNRSSGGGPAPPRMATTAPGEETLSGEPSGEGSSRPASPPASLRSKGFSLSNIFSIGRKKGDKVKKQLELENGNSSVTEAGCHGEEETGAFEANAEVRIEGWLKVMDSGKKWYRRWCTIRNNTLECYKEPGEEPHDFCMALRGVTLQNAAKETKKELALRLKSEDRGSLYLEASEAMEHGRWLNVLIKETELSNRMDIDSGYEAPVCSHDMKEAKRPPLPKTMPPIGRRRQRPESSAETQVDTAMASIKAKISSAECSEDDKRNISPTPASRQVTGKVRGSLKQNSWVKTSIDAFSPDDDDSITDPNVVRAHKGPTICEDQELLKITSNPLLKELRKERKKSSAWSETELEKLTESIGNLKRNVAQIKKKRAEVRGRKLRATQADERQSLEAELSILDQQLEDAEAELTKANMLKQEKEASLSRSNSQRSSPRLPRNTSISSATCRKSSTLPIKPSDSLDSTNKTNIKNVQNRFTENNNLPNRTGSENKTKSLTLGSSRDNVDGKTVTNRYLPPDRYSSYVTESQEPKNRTNGVSNNKNGIPRNGQNNSTRSDIKSTLLSGGVRSTVGRGSPSSSPVSARSTVGRSTAVAGGSKVGQPQKHIGVQEKLKLWETIGQGKESKA